jgi:hypothetical protein
MLARKTILRHTPFANRVDIRKWHIGREENPLGSESFAWRRTVDDCRERNSPPGNAARRPEVAHAWFQLWANLPSSPNMTAPRYQDTKAAEIPEIVDDDPHIGLATVTYLFDGRVMHRDSEGNALEITPGAMNLMTAGRGIAHSERSPLSARQGSEGLRRLEAGLGSALE